MWKEAGMLTRGAAVLMCLSEGWGAVPCRERGRSGASSGGLGGGGGAGETELQLQRRRLRSRIKVLKRQLDNVSLRLIAWFAASKA